MAKVGSRQFAYTPKGMKQAFSYSKRTGIKQEGGYGSKTITQNSKGKPIIKTIGQLMEIQGNERIAFDGTKVEVDTGSNALDFFIVLALIVSIYIAKKLIDKWLK